MLTPASLGSCIARKADTKYFVDLDLLSIARASEREPFLGHAFWPAAGPRGGSRISGLPCVSLFRWLWPFGWGSPCST
jgi:hypothetical protein